jgi:hypothetical protein
MTREEAIDIIKCLAWHTRPNEEDIEQAIEALEQEPFIDKIRAEIEEKIEQEEFARSVFRHEEKDTAKAEQCTGSIMAYKNMIKLIKKCKAESEEKR